MHLPTEGARWRWVDTPPASGAWNMAVDEALAEGVRDGGDPVVRVYRWAPPCLSLGRNQPARGRYDEAALAAAGIEVVRRPTGGRAVLHHRELTYAAVLPDGALGSPRQAYAAINRAIVSGLRRLGVDARLQPAGGPVARPSLAPCFDTPAEGEVTAGGRKLVGSAQRRAGRVLLQHGSLPLRDDQSSVRRFLAAPSPPEDAGPPPAALGDLLGREPPWEELSDALRAGWAEALGVSPVPSALTAAERGAAEALQARFRDPAWTWHL